MKDVRRSPTAADRTRDPLDLVFSAMLAGVRGPDSHTHLSQHRNAQRLQTGIQLRHAEVQ